MSIPKLQKYLVIILFVLIGLYYAILATMANFDLSMDRYVLYCDEHITFDGVRAILHPPNFKKFTYAILDGGDHRYGRILWNISALGSFIPERLYGAQGQIIATRMVQFSALLAAYLILVFSLITSWPLRALGFLALLSIPTTAYYASMPKPEPLQLFFLALFLWLSKKRQFAFGNHWIFLGLAFGAKISIFSLIPFFAIIAFFRHFQKSSQKKSMDSNFLLAIRFFFLGFLIAEPVFLLTLRKFGLQYVKTYLNWTFLSTGHGSDDLTVTWLVWLRYLFKDYSNIPSVLLIFSCLSIAILLFIYFGHLKRQIKSMKNISILFEKYSPLIILIAGLIFIIPNMVFVKRLWANYLHNGIALFLMGILGSVELSLDSRQAISKHNLAKYLSFLLLGLLLIESLFFLTPLATKEYIRLSRRTQEEDYKTKLKEYNYLIEVMRKISNKLERKVFVFFDTNLFVPYSSEKYNIEPYYGFFKYWSREKDIIICYKSSLENNPLLPKTSVSYEDQLELFQLYKEHVALPEEECKAQPCYYPFHSRMDALSIYINRALYGILGDTEDNLK